MIILTMYGDQSRADLKCRWLLLPSQVFLPSWRKPNDVEMKVVGSKAAQSIKNSNKKPI